MPETAKTFQQSSSDLPPGYVSIRDVEERLIIIPQFLIPGTQHAFNTSHNRSVNNVKGEKGGVRDIVIFKYTIVLVSVAQSIVGPGPVFYDMTVSDPGMSAPVGPVADLYIVIVPMPVILGCLCSGFHWSQI